MKQRTSGVLRKQKQKRKEEMARKAEADAAERNRQWQENSDIYEAFQQDDLLSFGSVSRRKVPAENVTRQAVYDFFNSLIAGQPPDEQVAILRDILVGEFCFNGKEEGRDMTTLEADIMEKMKNPALKIQCIKEVRELTGLGLAEAKQFVEALQPGHPTFGTKPISVGGSLQNIHNGIITEQFLSQLGNRLNHLAKNYNKPEPF